jgi:hypothetical protein
MCLTLLCVFTFCVPCCDVRYDFRIKFGSSLPPVVCGVGEGRGVSCLFYVVCVGLRVVVSKTYYAVFYFVFFRLVCPMLSVSVDCPFVLLLGYSLTFIYCCYTVTVGSTTMNITYSLK